MSGRPAPPPPALTPPLTPHASQSCASESCSLAPSVKLRPSCTIEACFPTWRDVERPNIKDAANAAAYQWSNITQLVWKQASRKARYQGRRKHSSLLSDSRRGGGVSSSRPELGAGIPVCVGTSMCVVSECVRRQAQALEWHPTVWPTWNGQVLPSKGSRNGSRLDILLNFFTGVHNTRLRGRSDGMLHAPCF